MKKASSFYFSSSTRKIAKSTSNPHANQAPGASQKTKSDVRLSFETPWGKKASVTPEAPQSSDFSAKPDPINYPFPWTFSNSVVAHPERNLKSFLPPKKLIEPKYLSALMKSFVDGIISNDLESLSEVCEEGFFEKLKERLESFKQKGWVIKESSSERKMQFFFDLYNIENIYGVGLNINRPKNGHIGEYTHRSLMLGQESNIPTSVFLKNKVRKEERLQLFSEFEFNVFTNVALETRNKHGAVVFPERNVKEFREALSKELFVHNLKVDLTIFECDYDEIMTKSRKNQNKKNKDFVILSEQESELPELDAEMLRPEEIRYKEKDYKITDFDFFLKGNFLCKF